MSTTLYGFKFEDGTRGGSIRITRIWTASSTSAPAVYAAQFTPAEPGSEMRGFGLTAAEAITDLFRAERDLVWLTGRPLPEPPENPPEQEN